MSKAYVIALKQQEYKLSPNDILNAVVSGRKNHQVFEFTNWYPGEPTDSNHLEDCIAMYPENYNFTWNDYLCTNKYNFLCES
ncbi:hypothetical protein KUTeg_014934, partial [Tegillarca granosa]